jgi:hypothetical protein
MPIDTHLAQQQGLTVPWVDQSGQKPKPVRDMVKIRAYLTLRAERAKRARLTQAHPTGPRPDEVIELTASSRSGIANPCATGPIPVAFIGAPPGYKWQRGKDNAERLVPINPVPVYYIVEKPKPIAAASIPKVGCNTTVGKDGRLRDANATGPVGTPDPNYIVAPTQNQTIKFVPKEKIKA